MKKKITSFLAFSVLLFSLIQPAAAQTTFVAGDIAFTGYHATSNTTDAFSFVLLKNVAASTILRFTENGWGNNSAFRTGENTISLSFSAAQNAGTEIIISGPPGGVGTATLALGGSAGTLTGSMLSLSVNGDQVIAYQSTTAEVAPFTFISAIHMNVYNGAPDPSVTDATNWDNLASTSHTANSSFKPTGLTTGVNCIWIGTQGNMLSERNNARFSCTKATAGSANLSTAAGVRAACNNQAFWDAEFAGSGDIPTWPLPSACAFIAAPAAPNFTLHPVNSLICEGTNTSFTVTANGAINYQWQVNTGGGFTNVSNNSFYSGATTQTLILTAPPVSYSGYIYRCIASNAGGPTNSNNGVLTVTALPVNPKLLSKTPATATVSDGTPVSATFTAGSSGTGCADDYRYTTNGGASYLPYTPGSNISTTGIAAGSGFVVIEGRRANCSSSCQNTYVVLASWSVTPLPASATTLNAGDIAFSGYLGFGASAAIDEFSFVLLRNIGPSTIINFTNNGWLSTNVFRTGEQTITWTSPSAMPAGTEIKIVGTTATRSGGGAAGTVTGTALSLGANGDQVLAYRGPQGSPTFISGIHKNVYSISNGDPTTTNAAQWDGAANTANASALPPGLTTGTNAIWIGTEGNINSEFDNAIYGTCSLPATLGPINGLRAALNNQANWSRSNGDPTGFNLPTGCNYLGAITPLVSANATLTSFAACAGANSVSQSFTVSGTLLTANIIVTAPADFEVSTSSGSGFGPSVTVNQSGGNVAATAIFVRTTAIASGSPAGNITVASTGALTVNVAVAASITAQPFNLVTISNTSATLILPGTTPHFTGPNCSQIVSVLPNGSSPVSGSTKATVWIQTIQPLEFVKRHYEIAPAVNAANATAKVTLYFTQAEFNDFNAVNVLDLPTNPSDVAGKSNLRIEKRAGTSSNGTGALDSYTGAITTIDPLDADIVWNATANRWEVSFDVTGFSGFFVKTNPTVLPVRWLSFTGVLINNNQAQLNWKVNETNVKDYEVQVSNNGTTFTDIANLKSKGDGINNYQFTEGKALNGAAFYRVKQADNDGKFSYSSTIKLSASGTSLLTIYPNPFKNEFNVQSSSTQTAAIVDAQGKVVKQIQLNAGQTNIKMAGLTQGFYILKTADGKVFKLFKE
jgi:hypothetical protein